MLLREYYKILPDEWKRADLTAKWWIIQEGIRDGKSEQDKLLDSILNDIKNILSTRDVSKFKLQKNYKNDKTIVGQCPICGKDIIESTKSFYCSGFKIDCNFSIWKSIAGKKLTKTNIKQLLENGITTLIVRGARQENTEDLYLDEEPNLIEQDIIMRPYYSWGNRGLTQMKI